MECSFVKDCHHGLSKVPKAPPSDDVLPLAWAKAHFFGGMEGVDESSISWPLQKNGFWSPWTCHIHLFSLDDMSYPFRLWRFVPHVGLALPPLVTWANGAWATEDTLRSCFTPNGRWWWTCVWTRSWDFKCCKNWLVDVFQLLLQLTLRWTSNFMGFSHVFTLYLTKHMRTSHLKIHHSATCVELMVDTQYRIFFGRSPRKSFNFWNAQLIPWITTLVVGFYIGADQVNASCA